ncbi:hypothetical protein [Burkholderia cenocepacia]
MVFLYVVTVEEKLEKSPKKDSVGALEQRADEAIVGADGKLTHPAD